MKKFIYLLLVLLLAGCKTDTSDLPYAEYLDDNNPEVIIDFNGTGKITLQLFPEVAPNTVNNFLELAQDGFYNELIIHRVIEGFIIQGGDPLGNSTGDAGYTIAGEFTANGFENNLSHYRGVISMARNNIMDSASSQFFIMHDDQPQLDGSYAAFGAIVDGFDTLDDIATVPTTNDKPDKDVSIKSIEINLNGYTMQETVKVEPLTNDFYLPGEFRNEDNPQVKITFSDDQEIILELFPNEAPITVENFLMLVEEGFYDGITMHRIIEDFMIQGGDPDGNGTGGSDTQIKGEFKANGVNNSVSHVRGVISMARSSSPNSGSSQFFIVHMDSTFLDGQYAAFGAIVTGFEALDFYATVETDSNDMPLEEVVIKSIERIK